MVIKHVDLAHSPWLLQCNMRHEQTPYTQAWARGGGGRWHSGDGMPYQGPTLPEKHWKMPIFHGFPSVASQKGKALGRRAPLGLPLHLSDHPTFYFYLFLIPAQMRPASIRPASESKSLVRFLIGAGKNSVRVKKLHRCGYNYIGARKKKLCKLNRSG